jgi:hypothetical protein
MNRAVVAERDCPAKGALEKPGEGCLRHLARGHLELPMAYFAAKSCARRSRARPRRLSEGLLRKGRPEISDL